MQAKQLMHSSWLPLRMSMAVGHTETQSLQSTQSPNAAGASAAADFAALPRGSPRRAS